MGLRDIAIAAQAEASSGPTLAEVQAEIEARVVACLGEGGSRVEMQVPPQHSAALLAWVEAEGMACGCQVQSTPRGRVHTLVILPRRASVVVTAEALAAQAAHDAEIVAAAEVV